MITLPLHFKNNKSESFDTHSFQKVITAIHLEMQTNTVVEIYVISPVENPKTSDDKQMIECIKSKGVVVLELAHYSEDQWTTAITDAFKHESRIVIIQETSGKDCLIKDLTMPISWNVILTKQTRHVHEYHALECLAKQLYPIILHKRG